MKKYNLYSRVRALTTTERYQLLIHIERTERSLIDWCNIPYGSIKSISADSLYKLAAFFKCNPDELINKQPCTK